MSILLQNTQLNAPVFFNTDYTSALKKNPFNVIYMSFIKLTIYLTSHSDISFLDQMCHNYGPAPIVMLDISV